MSIITTPVMASQARASDPQMQPPRRPLWPRGLSAVWHSQECLLVLGGPEPVTLRGKAVSTLLPALLPLLDGQRTAEELAADLPQFSARSVQQAINLLFMRGLLVSATQRPLAAAAGGALADAAAWVERHLDVTRVHESAGELMQQLQAARLLLLSDSPAAIDVIKTLRAQGLGAVELVSPDAQLLDGARALALPHFEVITHLDAFASFLARAGAEGFASDLAVLLSREPAWLLARSLSQQAFGTRMLYAQIGEAGVCVGPGLELPDSACLDCAHDSAALRPDRAGHFDAKAQALAAQRCAQRIFELLTRLTPVMSLMQAEWLDPETLRFEPKAVYRQFHCPLCGPAGHSERGVALGGQHLAPLAWVYHSQTQHEAAQILPKGHQQHYAPKNRQAASGGYKVYRSRPALPVAAIPPGSAFAQLTELVSLAVSKRELPSAEGLSLLMRLTPSGGGMSSQNIYLLSQGEAAPAGVHAFDPRGRWQQLSPRPVALQRLHVRGGDAIKPHDHVLMLSASHARLESKYMNMAYRYAWYDTGALLASLQYLAGQLGYGLRVTADFDDDAASELIGTPGSNEFVTALVFLDRRAEPQR